MPFQIIKAQDILIFIGVQLVIAISNAFLMRRLQKSTKFKHKPKVSVLIPARNEQENIAKCVSSLLAQSYDKYEVIVLDDESEDDTEAIIMKFSSPRLKIIEGQTLPNGWIGKHWACHQLAKISNGDIIFFTDADTIHHEKTIEYAVTAMEMENIDLLTAVIHQRVVSFGEKITVPFMVWSVFTILPLFAAYLFPRARSFAATNGQFLLIRRNVYEGIGGHEAVKDNVVDDMALGKLVRHKGYRWKLFDASKLVTCRMYHNFSEAFEGFSKNFFPLFSYKILIASFIWVWMLLITWQPIISASYFLIIKISNEILFISVLSIILSCFLWFFTSLRFNFPKYLFLFYPIIVSVAVITGFRSMLLTLSGKTTWRGRRLIRRKIRLV